MRLLCEQVAGLPRPLANVPIFDERGSFLGTPDLLDPVAGVVIEYDGALHLEGAQRMKDVRRESRFRRHGLEYVTMLAGDRHEPAFFIARLHTAYEVASHRPQSRVRWTLEQPRWWIDTTTVARRRALSEWDRARLLRHRVA